MAPQKWIDRRFDFSTPVAWYPEIIERLRGTPARVEDRVRGLDRGALVARPEDGSWALIEHIGHLADLDESLFGGRLDDFESEREALRAADMSNRLTHQADHRSKEPSQVIERLRRSRARLIERMESYPAEMFERVAAHPRLGQPMRMIDSMTFQAEHDDYHLARMSELIARLPAMPE